MHYLKPRLSEKAFAMSQATNTYVIDVPKALNSQEIAKAVTEQFGVAVVRIRLVNRPGKAKRVINLTGKRSTNRTGRQSDLRKAYVTLAKDSHLPFFQAEEAEIAEAAKEADSKKNGTKKSDKKDTKAVVKSKEEKPTEKKPAAKKEAK